MAASFKKFTNFIKYIALFVEVLKAILKVLNGNSGDTGNPK